jgi:enamine deaminase RidA (YjgF/YER057c/UK114 family)
MTLRHLNPDTLHASPAFSQGVLIEGPGALLVVGGQNGVDATGAVVSDELGAQTVQALRNVLAVLESVGASQADVAKLTIYLVAGGDVGQGYAAAQEVWGQHPTAITVLQVAGLARPDALVEIEALAQVPSG